MSETESADLQLEPAESEAVARDASDFARALADPTARARYEQLSLAASAGVVPAHLVAALETMLELLFEKGRPSNPAVLPAGPYLLFINRIYAAGGPRIPSRSVQISIQH